MSQILSEMEEGGSHGCLVLQVTICLTVPQSDGIWRSRQCHTRPLGLLHRADMVTTAHQQCCDAF